LVQISRCTDPVPDPLITVKGLGPVITAGLLAEISDWVLGLIFHRRSASNTHEYRTIAFEIDIAGFVILSDRGERRIPLSSAI
jgi:hypothetical protein